MSGPRSLSHLNTVAEYEERMGLGAAIDQPEKEGTDFHGYSHLSTVAEYEERMGIPSVDTSKKDNIDFHGYSHLSTVAEYEERMNRNESNSYKKQSGISFFKEVPAPKEDLSKADVSLKADASPKSQRR